ncbi:sodium/pantothenate symporter [Pseudobacillus badius]|uniref:sodium/pantothenate symporter n=1 Tax=Bacillus badius TaxID=1455 RepID=UPI0007B07A8A|nr:sodium/pantothenate symporter [Bacillus badius]KZN99589.1 sodium/panthothenate symporter [Bacillus badius]OCS85693.1 sodium/panthothenate symporter [Bacillus badius]OVE51953.1 sodium/panthothenate symporter [Bacillus badius]TDW03389.1 sodium/pantothenate symporter [Bacillus badius]UAT32108.1 sodium/pantothenate symporter [Bacillus badius]
MNMSVIWPLVVFLVIIFLVGVYASRHVQSSSSFIQEYFLGSRELGGFILAMTMAATYGSASSFLSGPGAAYNYGLSWVLLAMSQVATGYFVLMILGKKFAIMARKYQAVTLVDFLFARYKNEFVVVLAALSIIIFLFSAMAAQWIGGARLVESLTGLSYTTALIIFASSVLVYVVIGGFRAVAITDMVQGLVMVAGTVVLFIAALKAGGGMENIMRTLGAENPNLLSPYGNDRSLTPLYLSSFWILVGIGVVGLPQVAVRAMSYKNAKAMHRALIIGTVVVGVIMLGMHLIGVMARAIIPGVTVGDKVMPELAMTIMPDWLAGIVLAAPMAAIMSTVDSLLLLVSSAVVKDLYLHFINKKAEEKQVKKLSFIVTAVIGVIVFVVALQPPDLIIWLNLFSFGGLEAVFIWPVVLGLYWQRANGAGAASAMIMGMISYILLSTFYPNAFGMHTVVLPILLSLITFVAVSLFTGRSKWKQA